MTFTISAEETFKNTSMKMNTKAIRYRRQPKQAKDLNRHCQVKTYKWQLDLKKNTFLHKSVDKWNLRPQQDIASHLLEWLLEKKDRQQFLAGSRDLNFQKN